MKSRVLLGNAAALALVQGADYLVPLLAIPYLLRVLGVDAYGQIAFAQALCGYFLIVTEFGFVFSGTRAAAALREDKRRRSALFWEVQAAKLLLAAGSFLGVGMLLAMSWKLREMTGILLLAMLPVIGSVLFPLWMFQGLERLKTAVATMLVVRMTLLLAIFVLVKARHDIHLAAALMFLATPIAGVASWLLLARSGEIEWVRPTLRSATARMVEGKHAFLATASSSIYRSSNAVVLGFLSVPTAVAYYSLGEKLVRAAQELNRPLAQASYPRMSAYADADSRAANALFRKLLWMIGGLGACASVALFALAPLIIEVVGGPGLEGAIHVLRILAFVPLVGSFNLVLGVQTMHPFGLGRQFSRFVAISGAVNLALIVPLVVLWGASGAALGYLASEVVLLANLLNFHSKQSPVSWRTS